MMFVHYNPEYQVMEKAMGKLDLSKITVTRVLAVNKINISHIHSSYRENRECWAVSVKVGGRTVYRAGGRDYLSDSSHVIILPRGVSYRHSFEDLGECYMIEFEAEYDGDTPDITSYQISRNHDFINKMLNLERKWTFKKPAYELFCMSGVYDILAKLQEKKMSAYYSSSKYEVISPAVRFLEENYANTELSSDDLARVAGVSSVYFRKIFAAVFGQPPMRYLQTVRMEKAKDMLTGDYMPVSDIAESVGFKSIYHFSKTFKKIVGCTPTEYARRRRN